MNRKFHLGDVLSLTGDKLVSPRMMGGVWDLANYMTHDSLYTHQIIRALKVCGPWLLSQFPQLREVDDSSVTGENALQWLDVQIAKFGEYLLVEPLPEGVWQHQDPVEELKRIIPGAKVIVGLKAGV
jgi:hypothetical protein